MDALMASGEASLPACPECGWKAKTRGQLFRTRRRKALALAAAALALGAVAVGLTPKARRDGVWSIAPTWVMWGTAWTGYRSSDFTEELLQRIAVNGRDRRREDVKRLFRWTPSLRLSRGTWVKGVPLRVRGFTAYRSLLPGSSALIFGPSAIEQNGADVIALNSFENWWSPDKKLVADRTLNRETGFLEIMWNGSFTKGWEREADWERVRLVESLDEVAHPVPVERKVFVDALKPSLYVLPGTNSLALSVADPAGEALKKGVAVGFRAELMLEGRVLASGRWYQSAGLYPVAARPVLMRFGDERSLVYGGDRQMPLPLFRLIDAGCTVRFSTDPEMTLCAFECDNYWKGSFEVPLKELVK